MYVTYAPAKLYKHLYKHQYLKTNLKVFVMKSGEQMKGNREQGIKSGEDSWRGFGAIRFFLTDSIWNACEKYCNSLASTPEYQAILNLGLPSS